MAATNDEDKLMMTKLLGLLAQADVVQLVTTVRVAIEPVNNEPDNPVVRFAWWEQTNHAPGTYLTEAGLANASFDEAAQVFNVEDFEGNEMSLQLLANGKPLSPEDAPVFVLVQEGGSSAELYVHVHNTRKDAEDDRASCECDGAYRTSDIIEVPASLAKHPQFYEIAAQLVRATSTLDFPEESVK